MKELDVLLRRYVDERFSAAPAAEQQTFERLLEQPDPLIHAYCLGRMPIPPEFSSLIERIVAAGADAGSGQRC
jgi:succinate dehydrogenase flavin-adding protein (antitoxin of CptAB toxin-antitoxin module)